MSQTKTFRPPRSGRQSGTSLLETLIAAALLMFIAISLYPMFHRSLSNNVSGSDSNQATQHGKAELESLLGLPYDSQVFSMKNPLTGHLIEPDGTGDKMTIGDLYWDPAANVDTATEDPRFTIATGAWIADADQANGLVVWQRKSVVRQYSYSDIGDGVIDVNNTQQIVSQGHPMLFDTPLRQDASDTEVNFRQEDVTLESLRPGVPEFRVILMRGF